MDEQGRAATWEQRDALESAAADALGRIFFEFGRFETNLGLCVVWFGAGQKIEELTEEIELFGFGQKVRRLEEHVALTFPLGSEGRVAYDGWLARARGIGKTRNEFVHGRWAIDAERERVVNVVGLPTSERQRSVFYTPVELVELRHVVRKLDSDLGELRERWPL
jgi:hypothetical protein